MCSCDIVPFFCKDTKDSTIPAKFFGQRVWPGCKVRALDRVGGSGRRIKKQVYITAVRVNFIYLQKITGIKGVLADKTE
jgi:hypothetical protein